MCLIRVQQALIFAQFYLHSVTYMMHKALFCAKISGDWCWIWSFLSLTLSLQWDNKCPIMLTAGVWVNCLWTVSCLIPCCLSSSGEMNMSVKQQLKICNSIYCVSIATDNSSGSPSLPLWREQPLHPHLLKPSGKIFLSYNLPILVETKCSEIWRIYADDFDVLLCIFDDFFIYINNNK